MIGSLTIIGLVYLFSSVLASIAIIPYAMLKMIDLITWFRDKKSERISKHHKDIIAASVGAKIKNGHVKEIDCHLFDEEEEKYQMVQFLYDPKTDKILEARGITATSVSSEVQEAHRKGEIVVYKNV